MPILKEVAVEHIGVTTFIINIILHIGSTELLVGFVGSIDRLSLWWQALSNMRYKIKYRPMHPLVIPCGT